MSSNEDFCADLLQVREVTATEVLSLLERTWSASDWRIVVVGLVDRPMTTEEREEVLRLQGQGMGVREIARKFGRAPSTISRTLRAAREPAPKTNGKARQTAGRRFRNQAVSRAELRALQRAVAELERRITRMAAALVSVAHRSAAKPTRSRAGRSAVK